jgi:hypothetical protein
MHIRPLLALAPLVFAGLVAPAAEHGHAPGTGVQSLDVYANGTAIDRLTGELAPTGNGWRLIHSRSVDGGANWTGPVLVGPELPPPHSLHRGMDAQIASAGDKVIAAWTKAGTDKWGSGPIVVAVSGDGGKTWKAGANPADDGSTEGHGFIDLAAGQDGVFHATWLDSRDGRQGVRYARSTDGGQTWSKNITVKGASCECCLNTLALGSSGEVAILFRDGGPRDMGFALSKDGGLTWKAAAPVGRFNWEFQGCPHVGGGLVFVPGQSSVMHALVWTGINDGAGVYLLSSANRGEHWSPPQRCGGAGASHPDLAARADKRLAIVWDEARDGVAEILCSTSHDNGLTWSSPTIVSKPGGRASNPRVVATTKGFRVFWTQTKGEAPATVGSAAVGE